METSTIPEQCPESTAKPRKVRENTKQAHMIAMLQTAEGATVPQIMEATGWKKSTVLAFISYTVQKILGYKVTSVKNGKEPTVYHIKEVASGI